MSEVQHHLRCGPGDVAPYVLLPGDPARAEVIASHFDEARQVAENREYLTFTGTSGGVPVSVTSTGIGCPSMAIAVEELARIGVQALIRVGTGGAMQSHLMPGDLVVATSAVRDEGTSAAYLPRPFPAVADFDLTWALSEAAEASNRNWHRGVIHSKDSFYGQKEPERMPVAEELQAKWRAWVRGGALLSEMETATLFIVGAVLGVAAGSICTVASNDEHGVRLAEGAEREQAIADLTDCALDAVRRYHDRRRRGEAS
ncbi:MAG: nucleoside phosphorylase [Anaerolineales bacterium]|nr:nucleoside phosphorylase [Anaerolineales bacterium]